MLWTEFLTFCLLTAPETIKLFCPLCRFLHWKCPTSSSHFLLLFSQNIAHAAPSGTFHVSFWNKNDLLGNYSMQTYFLALAALDHNDHLGMCLPARFGSGWPGYSQALTLWITLLSGNPCSICFLLCLCNACISSPCAPK